MAKSLEQLLIGIEHNQQLVDYHSAEVKRLLREYVLLQGPVPVPYSSKMTGMKGNVKSLVLWTEWLAENRPAYRQTITDATGIRLSEKAKPRMLQWSRLVDVNNDSAHPADTVCYIQDKPTGGRGRPQMIYFLWSQRWDVHPLFGVGPIKPSEELATDDDDGWAAWPESDPVDNLGQEYLDRMTADRELTTEDEEAIAELLGRSDSEPTDDTTQFSTVDEWNEAWAGLFDSLAATESKPSDGWRLALLDSLPEGADGNSLIASAYAEAVKRSREPQTLLGVIHPPEAVEK